MSDAQPTAGHKLTMKLNGDQLQIDLQSPLVALVSDLLDTLPNAFALARVIETMAAASTTANTACDADISDVKSDNPFAFFDDKKYAFPDNDLDEPGNEPRSDGQGTNVLDDSTLFGVVGDDNTTPPQRKNTLLDVLGGWADDFFNNNADFAKLTSKANRRLLADALAGRIDLADLNSAQANKADGSSPNSSTGLTTMRDFIRKLAETAAAIVVGSNIDTTAEPRINVWDGEVREASAQQPTDDVPAGDSITLSQSQNLGYGQENPSPANAGAAPGRVFDMPGTGEPGTRPHATPRKMPKVSDFEGEAGRRKGVVDMSMGHTYTLPFNSGCGENELNGMLIVTSNYQLDPSQKSWLHEINCNLARTNVPALYRKSTDAGKAPSYFEKVTVIHETADTRVQATLAVEATLGPVFLSEAPITDAYADVVAEINRFVADAATR